MMKQIPSKKQNAVKINAKPLLAIMVCIVLTYSACRKDTAPSNTPQAVATPELGGQVAVNLAQSLAGNFGGVNLMDGVDSVSLAGHLGPHKLATVNTLCGFFTDSLVNYNSQSGDTTNHTGGNLTFYFNCQDGQSTGYTAYDSLNTVRNTPSGSHQYYVKQYYTIKSLDAQHQLTGVNGDIYFYDISILKCGCTTIENVNYVLKDLTINTCGCSKDILSGTATFKAYGKNWSATGTVTFLGNHMADVLINGITYHVNIKTGKVTT
ncbi:MAG: hypothetical protein ABI203_00865 [Mucilaginibacter sp.]